MRVPALALALCLIVAAPAAASTIPFVDGRYSPGEGYTTMYNVGMTTDQGQSLPGGQLWLAQDPSNSDLYLAFIVPTDYVDNTYGANSSVGYRGKSGQGHTFKDLLKSDEAVLEFYTGSGQLALETSIDYLVKYGPKNGPNTYAAAASDNTSAGFTGGTSQVASSLQYNFATFGQFLTDSSTDPGWIDAVIYEMKVDGTLFANDGFGSVVITRLHASPSKVDVSGAPTLTPGGGGADAIPEPGTILLLGSGLLGVVGYRHLNRRKKKA